MLSDTMNLEYVNEEFYSFGTEVVPDLDDFKNNNNEKSAIEASLNFGDNLFDSLEFCKDLPTPGWLTETQNVRINDVNGFSSVDWLNGNYDSGLLNASPSPSSSSTSSFEIESLLSPISSEVSSLSPIPTDLSVLSPATTSDCSEFSPACTDDGSLPDGYTSSNNEVLKSEDPEVQSLFDLINSVSCENPDTLQSNEQSSQVGPIKHQKHTPAASPYSKPPRKPKTPEQKSRKKSQNRTAATRYRIKKKDEYSELMNEANKLEDKNTILKTQVGSLQTEIDYLKSLMLDVIKARLAKNNQTVTIVTVNQNDKLPLANVLPVN